MPSNENQEQDGLLVVEEAAEPGRIRLALRGELDLSNVTTAEAALLRAFASGEEVLVDLGELEFLDSTGVSLLVMALRLKETGLSFLPSDSPEVDRLLSLTGLDGRMEFAAAEAVPPPALPAA